MRNDGRQKDVVEASGSFQLCAGQKSGSEAVIHAMHAIFEADDTDAVLVIDASNAFNALNRAAALHNIRILCPVIATYAINTYRQPARLFITAEKRYICPNHSALNFERTSNVQCEAMLVCRLFQKLGSGGMSLAPLVQILGIFRTTRNAGLLQNQLKKKVSEKFSRKRLLMYECKGRSISGQ